MDASRPLYFPDYAKFKHYFDKHATRSSSRLVNGKMQRMVIPVHRQATQQQKADPPTKVTLQMTSESQSEVERAEAHGKREKALKRKAGAKCVTTKKIRRTDNINAPSKTAKVLKCTPVKENDIFS